MITLWANATMTNAENYPSDETISRPSTAKNLDDSAYLPPDFTERLDAFGRSLRPEIWGDGRVKRRDTPAQARRRMRSIIIHKAIEVDEEVNASLVASLRLYSRPDRLIVAHQAITQAVIERFKWANISLAELRDTSQRCPGGLISYVRRIWYELQCRHGKWSSKQFAEWACCDHSSISYARARVRAEIVLNDPEARALRADINAITVHLATQYDWMSEGVNYDARSQMISRLLKFAKSIESSNMRAAGDIVEVCNIVMREATP